jgi:hypothetical protein
MMTGRGIGAKLLRLVAGRRSRPHPHHVLAVNCADFHPALRADAQIVRAVYASAVTSRSCSSIGKPILRMTSTARTHVPSSRAGVVGLQLDSGDLVVDGHWRAPLVHAWWR